MASRSSGPRSRQVEAGATRSSACTSKPSRDSRRSSGAGARDATGGGAPFDFDPQVGEEVDVWCDKSRSWEPGVVLQGGDGKASVHFSLGGQPHRKSLTAESLAQMRSRARGSLSGHAPAHSSLGHGRTSQGLCLACGGQGCTLCMGAAPISRAEPEGLARPGSETPSSDGRPAEDREGLLSSEDTSDAPGAGPPPRGSTRSATWAADPRDRAASWARGGTRPSAARGPPGAEEAPARGSTRSTARAGGRDALQDAHVWVKALEPESDATVHHDTAPCKDGVRDLSLIAQGANCWREVGKAQEARASRSGSRSGPCLLGSVSPSVGPKPVGGAAALQRSDRCSCSGPPDLDAAPPGSRGSARIEPSGWDGCRDAQKLGELAAPRAEWAPEPEHSDRGERSDGSGSQQRSDRCERSDGWEERSDQGERSDSSRETATSRGFPQPEEGGTDTERLDRSLYGGPTNGPDTVEAWAAPSTRPRLGSAASLGSPASAGPASRRSRRVSSGSSGGTPAAAREEASRGELRSRPSLESTPLRGGLSPEGVRAATEHWGHSPQSCSHGRVREATTAPGGLAPEDRERKASLRGGPPLDSGDGGAPDSRSGRVGSTGSPASAGPDSRPGRVSSTGSLHLDRQVPWGEALQGPSQESAQSGGRLTPESAHGSHHCSSRPGAESQQQASRGDPRSKPGRDSRRSSGGARGASGGGAPFDTQAGEEADAWHDGSRSWEPGALQGADGRASAHRPEPDRGPAAEAPLRGSRSSAVASSERSSRGSRASGAGGRGLDGEAARPRPRRVLPGPFGRAEAPRRASARLEVPAAVPPGTPPRSGPAPEEGAAAFGEDALTDEDLACTGMGPGRGEARSQAAGRGGGIQRAPVGRARQSCSQAPGVACGRARREAEGAALAELRRGTADAQMYLDAHLPPPRSCRTAAAKWAHARSVAERFPAIEAWGSGSHYVNGTYRLLASGGAGATGPPAYQSQAELSRWLYVGTQGQWYIGGDESKDARKPRRQRGYLRSADAVEPGTLPHAVGSWEVLAAGDFVEARGTKFWLPEAVQTQWQEARVEACECPVVRLSGLNAKHADGLFDFVPGASSAGEPPVFRHQVFRCVWLYLASDQQWWIGSEAHMVRRTPMGIAHSDDVQPGQLPWAVRSPWAADSADNSFREAHVKIKPVETAMTAADKWAEARERATSLEFWGNATEHGTYVLATASESDASQPPVYQRRSDADLWLYVADDGHWWFGSAASRDQRSGGSWLRSRRAVAPGILPDEVEGWTELTDHKVWKEDCDLAFFTPESAAAAWRAAREVAAEAPVVRLTGVPEGIEDCEGLYDFMPEASGDDEAPAFQHQVNQERWLYLASDGRWWVGDHAAMERRQPLRGSVRSWAARPGQLPGARPWQAFRHELGAWQDEDELAVC